MLLETFLGVNGYELVATDSELLSMIWAVAAHEAADAVFTDWVRTHTNKAAHR